MYNIPIPGTASATVLTLDKQLEDDLLAIFNLSPYLHCHYNLAMVNQIAVNAGKDVEYVVAANENGESLRITAQLLTQPENLTTLASGDKLSEHVNKVIGITLLNYKTGIQNFMKTNLRPN